MYKYHQYEEIYPRISLHDPGSKSRQLPVPKRKRDPPGSIKGELVAVFFKFDMDRYAALVKILDRTHYLTIKREGFRQEGPISLGQFVRIEIDRWHKDHYIFARYDLSYKPAHIIEGIQLRISISRSTRDKLNKAAKKGGFTVSALLRVLVERKMDEVQSLCGP